jgi:predicted dehydrogenase
MVCGSKYKGANRFIKKKRFVIVGAGGRGLPTFAKGLLGWPDKGWEEFVGRATVCGVMDSNIERCKVTIEELRRRPMPYEIPMFDDLGKAIDATKPDWAIICVPDRAHLEVCLLCLSKGVNLWVEKPLATSVWECDRILVAAKKRKLDVRVAHNYRHYRWIAMAEKMLKEGKIGKILSFRVGEILGDGHGGDYFHRWHSDFDVSAGMLNHKACHHFDIIFWLMKDSPVCAQAMGSRALYMPRKDIAHGKRCSECKLLRKCPHAIDMDVWDGIYRRMYIDAEKVDGYIRDKCVFSDRHTIYDNYSVNFTMKSGVIGNYILTNYGPREYVFFEFVGTNGSLEAGQDALTKKEYLRIVRQRKSPDDGILAGGAEAEEISFDDEGGMHGHGGADVRMLASFLGYKDGISVDPKILATGEEAKFAVLAADMANRSLAKKGIPIWAKDTGKDFPPAPPQKTWCG